MPLLSLGFAMGDVQPKKKKDQWQLLKPHHDGSKIAANDVQTIVRDEALPAHDVEGVVH